jgi:hypothetical protein
MDLTDNELEEMKKRPLMFTPGALSYLLGLAVFLAQRMEGDNQQPVREWASDLPAWLSLRAGMAFVKEGQMLPPYHTFDKETIKQALLSLWDDPDIPDIPDAFRDFIQG